MRPEVVSALNAITREFYERFGAQFSATREDPWPGWRNVAEEFASGPGVAGTQVGARVLDVGCGNYRFEEFMLNRFPDYAFAFYGVDYCPMPPCRGSHLERADITAVARDIMTQGLAGPGPGPAFGSGLALSRAIPPADLTVAFGLMHHVPSQEKRGEFLRELAQATAPGGLIAVSFWQFARLEALRKKAETATQAGAEVLARRGVAPGDLEPGDYLLGWQDFTPEQGAVRYCHSFSEDEVDALSQGIADLAREAGRFSADGRTGDLNRYLLWRRR